MSLQLSRQSSRRGVKLAGAFFAVFTLLVQPLVSLNIPQVFAADSIVVTPSSHSFNGADDGPVEMISAADATGYENLELTFDYDIGNLEAGGDSFTYGWRVVGTADTNNIDTIEGETNNPGPNEEGSVETTLPADASDENLELYFINDSSATNDTITVSSIAVNGTALPTVEQNAVCSTGCEWTTLAAAVAGEAENETIQIRENQSLSSQVTINKPVTINGNGFTVSSAYSFTDNSNNSALGIIGTSNVTINNLIVEGVAGTSLHGINVFGSSNIQLNGVTSRNNDKSGVAVNGSTVTVTNITTSGNGWHGMNSDKPGAVLTVNGVSTHSESGALADIYVDNKNVGNVVDTNNQYVSEPSGLPGRENDMVYRLKPAPAACNGSAFDNFALGSVNGQNGWKATNSNIDQEVTDNIYGYETFGCKTLRISNSYTSGSFGDQTFSAPASVKAGESEANDRYETSFSFGSAKQTAQPGLALSISPDDGVGNRMSYVGLADTTDGTSLTFYDTDTDGSFNAVPLGSYPREEAVTVKFEIEFRDGPSNDVVKVFVNGELKHTGTTWEDYYRYSSEQAGNNNVVPGVDRLLIRAAGAPVPATANNGFIFDNVTVATTSSDTTGPSISKIRINGETISGAFKSNANCDPADQLYLIGGDMTLTAVIEDVSGVSSASYKVRKLNAGGCTVSSVYSSGAVALKQSTKNASNWNQNDSFDLEGENLNGTYAVQLTTADSEGNQTVQYVHLNVDNVTPTVTVKDGYVGDKNKKVFRNVSFKLYDQNKIDRLTLNGVEKDLTDSQWSDLNGVKPGTFGGQEGTNELKVYDVAGNETVYTFVLDTTAPDAEITSPSADSTVGGTVNVVGAVTDENPMNTYFRITGPNDYVKTDFYGDGRATHEFDWDVSGLAEGVYTIRFETRDRAQNKDSGSVAQINVTVDNTAPGATTITSPTANQEFAANSGGDTIRAEWSPVDGATLYEIRYQYLVNGEPTTATRTTTNTFRDQQLSGNVTGKFTIDVRARDAAGNWGEYSVPVSYYYGESAPDDNEPGEGSDNGDGGENGPGSTPEQPLLNTNEDDEPLNLVTNTVLTPSTIVANTFSTPGVIDTGDDSDDDGDVLGTADNSDDEGSVLGQTAAIAPSSEGWKLWGMAWYWFALAAAAIAGLWWLLAAWRRRQTEEEF